MAKTAGKISTYTVDMINSKGHIIDAATPLEAVKKALGVYAKDYKIVKGSNNANTRVCLLGGTRESISFYNVSRIVKSCARVQIFVNKGGQITAGSIEEAKMIVTEKVEADKIKPGKLDLAMFNVDITSARGRTLHYVLSGYGYIIVKDIPSDNADEIENFVQRHLLSFNVGDFDVSDWKIVDIGRN